MIDRLQTGNRSRTDECSQILELTSNEHVFFESQEPAPKKRRLNILRSTCLWNDGEVVTTFRKPYPILAKKTAIAATRKETATASPEKTEFASPSRVRNPLGPPTFFIVCLCFRFPDLQPVTKRPKFCPRTGCINRNPFSNHIRDCRPRLLPHFGAYKHRIFSSGRKHRFFLTNLDGNP